MVFVATTYDNTLRGHDGIGGNELWNRKQLAVSRTTTGVTGVHATGPTRCPYG